MNTLTLWFHKMGSPPTFYRVASRIEPWLFATALLCAAVGLYLGLFRAPADYLQGESARILYIHVPCAWMSLFVYAFMALNGAIAIVWRIKLSEQLVVAAAPIGAAFTAITLVTGALWGKPTWGTYWVWDARLTSELVLLFLYFGVIGLERAIEDRRKAARAASLLAIVGVVNLPIIHFSVKWWNTLHQGATISMTAAPKMAHTMLTAMLLMTFACWAYAFAVVFMRTRAIVVEREQHTEWVSEMVRSREART